ncbi:flagellin N-terminal helical domain-containing protein [Anaerovorax sp. IOR16]|uniref:flagellin N-terminal helical domain-containing protein n=1 Tax=Anaerovorax sp. IOR16 TaxID=2773458 RepID=UPI0019D196DD|nr:flagellin [Anaerovorax sp. IOR16]
MRIQHNIAALNSYRQLGGNNAAVGKNLEKLSSGFRINRAGDDAAGLAISEKMRAQIKGLETAQKNANDGISLVQTAEGALTEVHSMLNRMVELATQSSNGTYDDTTDRANLQKEIESLKSEVDRIAESTNFNGIKLLDGSLAGGATKSSGIELTGRNVSTFTAAEMEGATAINTDLSAAMPATDTFTVDGQTLTIDWSKGDAKTLFTNLDKDNAGLTADQEKDIAAKLTDLFNAQMKEQGLSGSVTVTADTTTHKLTLQSNNEGSTSSIGWTGSSLAQADAAKSLGTLLFSATPGTGAVVEAGKDFANTVVAGDAFTMTINGTTLEVTGVAGTRGTDSTATVAASLQTAIQNTVDAYNTAMGTGGTEEALTKTDFTVSVDKNGGFNVKYEGDVEGVTFSFGEKTEDGVEGIAASLLGLAGKSSAGAGGTGLSLQVGDTNDDFQKVTVSVGAMDTRSLEINNINISNQNGAGEAIEKIKDAINSVSATRGDLGAIQNRLEHTINNLGVTQENMTAAESRVRDVDMAKEMMEFTKNNILTQAAQAMLAQANQLPQGVLQLLQ